MNKKRLLISFSGGRTSAFMTWWLLNTWPDRNNWEIIVVFANTGKEREETLHFIKECDLYFHFNTYWIEAITRSERGRGVGVQLIDFKSASRNGEPFEQMIRKHGLPSVKSPHCTRELKKRAIKAFCRSIGWKEYYTAIGIRIDEIDRISPSAEKEKFIYPLISNVPTKKIDINKFWSQQKFDLKLKSYEGNCDLCFKKSFRKLMTIVNETPLLTEWWLDMEKKYSNFIPEGKKHNPLLIPPIHCFRLNKSINDIIDMAKNNFDTARDESQYYPEYVQSDLWGVELDISNGCTESCEVF